MNKILFFHIVENNLYLKFLFLLSVYDVHDFFVQFQLLPMVHRIPLMHLNVIDVYFPFKL